MISESHIQNCKLLLNREALIDLLPKNKIVAEVGVHEGVFAEKIYEIAKPEKLILIDYWPHEKPKKDTERRLLDGIVSGKVEMIEDFCEVALPAFSDRYFDWVYLDACHRYQPTLDALNILSYKVKEDGYIAGHDFCNGFPSKGYDYGVIKAVYEFCERNRWSFKYLALDPCGHLSFCLEKLR